MTRKNLEKIIEESGQTKNIDLLTVPGFEDSVIIIRPRSMATTGFPIYLENNSLNASRLWLKSCEDHVGILFSLVCGCCHKHSRNIFEIIEFVCQSNGITTIVTRKYCEFENIENVEVSFFKEELAEIGVERW